MNVLRGVAFASSALMLLGAGCSLARFGEAEVTGAGGEAQGGGAQVGSNNGGSSTSTESGGSGGVGGATSGPGGAGGVTSGGGQGGSGGGCIPSAEDCLDGVDNDCDGDVDCADGDCDPDYTCVAAVTVLGYAVVEPQQGCGGLDPLELYGCGGCDCEVSDHGTCTNEVTVYDDGTCNDELDSMVIPCGQSVCANFANPLDGDGADIHVATSAVGCGDGDCAASSASAPEVVDHCELPALGTCGDAPGVCVPNDAKGCLLVAATASCPASHPHRRLWSATSGGVCNCTCGAAEQDCSGVDIDSTIFGGANCAEPHKDFKPGDGNCYDTTLATVASADNKHPPEPAVASCDPGTGVVVNGDVATCCAD